MLALESNQGHKDIFYVADHFADVSKMVPLGSSRQGKIDDRGKLSLPFWYKMKIRVKDEEASELSTFCRQLKLQAPDGKMILS